MTLVSIQLSIDTAFAELGGMIILLVIEDDSIIYDVESADGQFLAEDIPKGTSLRLIVSKEKYLTYDSLEAGEERTLRKDEETWKVDMVKGGTKLIVKTVNSANLPIANVAVELFNAGAEKISEQKTGFSGEIEFSGLDINSNYIVSGWLQGYLPAVEEVNTAVQGEITLSILIISTGIWLRFHRKKKPCKDIKQSEKQI